MFIAWFYNDPLELKDQVRLAVVGVPSFFGSARVSVQFLLQVGGVGKAIADMFAAEGTKCIGIQLTGGDTETREGNTFHVSKSHVVGKLLQRWDEGKVLIPSKAPKI